MERSKRQGGFTCRLLRADGSEWHVLELRGGERHLRVDAVRAGASGVPASTPEIENGTKGAATPAEAPDRGAESGPGVLHDELLGRGDRLQWLDEGGDVLWSMKLPMDQARSTNGPGTGPTVAPARRRRDRPA